MSTPLEGLLAQGRAAHEALMVDTITIHRPGPSSFDQATGEDIPGTDLVLYQGPARVKPSGLVRGTQAEAGEQEIRLRDFEIAVPWSTTVPPGQVIRPDDQVHVTASPDPRLTGATLWVTGRQFNATATAWRIYAEDREARNGN